MGNAPELWLRRWSEEQHSLAEVLVGLRMVLPAFYLEFCHCVGNVCVMHTYKQNKKENKTNECCFKSGGRGGREQTRWDESQTQATVSQNADA